MNILLDESAPRLIKTRLPQFSIRTVQEMGWAGMRSCDSPLARYRAGSKGHPTGSCRRNPDATCTREMTVRAETTAELDGLLPSLLNKAFKGFL